MFTILGLPQRFYAVFGVFILFRVLHFIVTNYISLPISLESSTVRKKWVYRNILVSFVHSAITAFLSVYCFFDEPEMLTNMLGAGSSLAVFLITISTGYFLHDFLDMLLNDASQSIGLLIHHIVVVAAFSIALFKDVYAGFAVCSLLMEVNSVFLHFRRLMCLRGVNKTSLLYKINGIMLLMTFVNFRFLTSAWMTNFVIQRRGEIPFSHFFFSAIGMAIISVQNIQIFMAYLRADFKRDQAKKGDN